METPTKSATSASSPPDQAVPNASAAQPASSSRSPSTPDARSPQPASGGDSRWLTLRSMLVGVAFLSFFFWLLPRVLGFQVELAGAQRWRLLAAVPSALGFATALRCVWAFGAVGHGTPAPILPPKRLVVVGPYRYVRNPMYCAFFCGWGGLWVMFGHPDRMLMLAALGVAVAMHGFVVYYEEPTLRRKFGEEYCEYCRNVPRWLPRRKAWMKETG